MAAPGWYRDPGSDRLARWFDGGEWTHHTVVMDDWRGKGSPPPPEDRTIVQSSSDAYPGAADTAWAAPTGYEDFQGHDTTFGSYEDEPFGEDYVMPGAVGAGAHYRQPTLADRYLEGPAWFRFGAPAVLLLIVAVAVAALAGGGDGGGDGGTVDLGDEDVTLDEAIDIAFEAGFPDEVSEARLGSLIKLACEQVGETDGPEVVAEQVLRFDFDGADQTNATKGLEAGGEAFCGDDVAAEDADFFRQVATIVGGSVPSSTSSTSSTTIASTTTSSGGSTSTTKKPTTSTTRPATTTTKAPTTTTTAPATTTSEVTTTTTTTTLPPILDGGTTG